MTTACGDAGLTPEAAQALQTIANASFDASHHVEVHSPENSAFSGKTYYSDVSHVGDVWLLRQRNTNSKWMRYGMLVRNGRVYFASLDRRAKMLGAECVQCHADGPRALRGDLRAGTEADRLAINTLIENIGVVEPYYPPADPPPAEASHRLAAAACARCHDGKHRAWLTGANQPAIAFLVGHGFMPPDGELTPEQRTQVEAFAKSPSQK